MSESRRPKEGAVTGGSSVRAIFLDRDGVINVRLPDGAYVTRWEEFAFCEGAVEGMRLMGDQGCRLIVVTNQRGIGRGIMSEDDLADVHRRMEAALAAGGVVLDAIYHCPHDHDALCNCRKPKPGMLMAAAERFGLDLAGSLIIGDSVSDLEAGLAAGVKGILVVPDGEERPPGYRSAPSLLAAARMVIDEEGR